MQPRSCTFWKPSESCRRASSGPGLGRAGGLMASPSQMLSRWQDRMAPSWPTEGLSLPASLSSLRLLPLQAMGTPPEVLAEAAKDAALSLLLLSKRGFDALVRPRTVPSMCCVFWCA